MILVVGGTGELGGRVVRLLREQGADVRCLLRPGRDESALRDLGVEAVHGDLTDPESLAAACRGVSVVVATATAIARRLTSSEGPSLREVDEDGMAALVEAAESAGVQRFVYLSFPDVDVAPALGVDTPLGRAKRATEQRLGRSSLSPVIVRSDAFQEIHLGPTAQFDVAAGKVAILGKGDTRQRWVAVDDVAALVASLAVEQDPPRMVSVGGPEAMSKNEAVALVESLTGRRMKVRHLPRPVARAATRLLARRKDGLASVLGLGLLQDLHAADVDDGPLRERGIEPRSASAFLRQEALSASPPARPDR